MSPKFVSFYDLLKYLENRKKMINLKRTQNPHQYRLDLPGIKSELEALYNQDQVLSLITSYEELYSAFEQFPVYAQSMLSKKRGYITTLRQLVRLKDAYAFLPIPFMVDQASHCDIQNETTAIILLHNYSFLMKPLFERSDNREKVTRLGFFFKIIPIVPEVGPALLKNEHLRGNIKRFSEVCLIVKKAPECAPVLLLDKRIRHLLKSYCDLNTFIQINKQVAKHVFQYKSLREQCKTVAEQFEILCLLSDDQIALILEYFFNGQVVRSDISEQFLEASLKNGTTRGREVFEIVSSYLFHVHQVSGKRDASAVREVSGQPVIDCGLFLCHQAVRKYESASDSNQLVAQQTDLRL